jgi:hypothetical protein
MTRRIKPQEIADYYAIPDHVLESAFPQEYAEYKEKDAALVKIIEELHDDIGGARSFAIIRPKKHGWDPRIVPYMDALHDAIGKLQSALDKKRIPAEPTMKCWSDEITWVIPGETLFGVRLTKKGEKIVDALGCHQDSLYEL